MCNIGGGDKERKDRKNVSVSQLVFSFRLSLFKRSVSHNLMSKLSKAHYENKDE